MNNSELETFEILTTTDKDQAEILFERLTFFIAKTQLKDIEVIIEETRLE